MRRKGGKTISKRGQEWTLPVQLGQMKTGQDGKGLLRIQRPSKVMGMNRKIRRIVDLDEIYTFCPLVFEFSI